MAKAIIIGAESGRYTSWPSDSPNPSGDEAAALAIARAVEAALVAEQRAISKAWSEFDNGGLNKNGRVQRATEATDTCLRSLASLRERAQVLRNRHGETAAKLLGLDKPEPPGESELRATFRPGGRWYGRIAELRHALLGASPDPRLINVGRSGLRDPAAEQLVPSPYVVPLQDALMQAVNPDAYDNWRVVGRCLQAVETAIEDGEAFARRWSAEPRETWLATQRENEMRAAMLRRYAAQD